jgi:signal transduction histidine kinase
VTLRSLVVVPPAGGVALLALLDPSWAELKNFAPTIVIAFLVLWATLKLAPVRHEEKMRELDVREKEVAQRDQSAVALQSMADTVRDIAIEQRHATEALRIAERVTIREGEKLSETVHEMRETVHAVVSRVEMIEAKAATA